MPGRATKVFSSVQSLSHVRLFVNPWTAARQASLSITNSQNLLRLMSIKSVMPSNHLVLCRPILLLPSIFPSIRVFSNESALRIRWWKYWRFSFGISPSNEHPGLISPRMDWMDLLAVQGTLKSLLQHHSSKASILQPSAFFTVQLSHPYMTTGKTIAFTKRALVGKVMSQLFNVLSRLVIAFLPRSKRLLISWLQSPSEGTKVWKAAVFPDRSFLLSHFPVQWRGRFPSCHVLHEQRFGPFQLLTPVCALLPRIRKDSPDGPQLLWMMRLQSRRRLVQWRAFWLDLWTRVGRVGQWILGVGSGGSVKKVSFPELPLTSV